MTHASESGHFYYPDGTPCYEVVGAKGQKIKPDIRHARKLGLFPGVTSVMRCAAAPGLENWKQQQVLMAALTLPRIEGETSEQLCARIMADSGEQARQARDKGTAIHAAIQGHYEGKPPSEEMWPYVQGVVATIRENCGALPWLAELACANPLGYGTKSDLHAPDADCAWAGTVLDFKGSDFTAEEAPKLKTWDEHAMQLAATREALVLPDARCAIVYASRKVPGLCRLIWIDEQDLRRGWTMFQALLAFWQAKNNCYPQSLKAAA